MTAQPWRVDVVVPARDEETHIVACAAALLTARQELRARRPDTACGITFVLDDCHDRTAERLRATVAGVDDVHVRTIRTGSVGAARADGVTSALTLPGPAAGSRWVANSDADSVVPAGWLVQQADALRDGVDVLVGAVVPDPADLTEDVLVGWRAAHPVGVVLGHTHGANLGIRADVLRALGGFTRVPEHEDVLLVERARAAGHRVVAVGDLPVVTSGRFVGRTPGGYAAHLAATYAPPALDAS